jgi:tryptophanyl-tRNA synthetase
MSRGLFFAHRELKQVLDAKETGKPIFIYTGRGPSSDALHLGHLVPFILTKYLQDALDCFLIIQISDDEKYLRDSELSWETINAYAESNIRDIIAQGFNPDKTFIMRQSKYADINVPFLTEMSKVMSLHVVNNLFGFTPAHNLGYVVFPAKQIAPAFADYFCKLFTHPKDVVCLIPSGREQDPYFRFAREMAKRLKKRRMSTLYGRFIPALHGARKMTASMCDSAIYITDPPEEIARKIHEVAETQWTPDGADLEKDVVYKYLWALDPDDGFVGDLKRRYGPGELAEGEVRMTTGEAKARLIEVINGIIGRHQREREAVTPELVARFEALKVWN